MNPEDAMWTFYHNHNYKTNLQWQDNETISSKVTIWGGFPPFPRGSAPELNYRLQLTITVFSTYFLKFQYEFKKCYCLLSRPTTKCSFYGNLNFIYAIWIGVPHAISILEIAENLKNTLKNLMTQKSEQVKSDSLIRLCEQMTAS